MNRFLSSAFFFVILSAASAQAQTQNTSAAPAGWAEPVLDPWTMNAPTKAEKAADQATDEPATYNTGWSSAPGISLSLHDKPSTDWWGRPIKKKAKNNLTTAPVAQATAADEASDDPMMHSSGVMIAPGMNTAPYRGTSTDYWGRPVRKAQRQDAKVAAKIAKSSTVATTASSGE
ncbi:hypothetical protein [Hymenobacter cellulosivorans]|uniref:Uncharacterized protein n=1 Tax=Hymenobacter cellulosivorans TaxID=2932249 RepID=A0ABY4FBF5_9BACT|nr:hypothetical protein [Hymenobacter cellulosivorans]UOQ53750.1 hypothetical protein MUN80_03075 [Hymenobacter cellulosivorans]